VTQKSRLFDRVVLPVPFLRVNNKQDGNDDLPGFAKRLADGHFAAGVVEEAATRLQQIQIRLEEFVAEQEEWETSSVATSGGDIEAYVFGPDLSSAASAGDEDGSDAGELAVSKQSADGHLASPHGRIVKQHLRWDRYQIFVEDQEQRDIGSGQATTPTAEAVLASSCVATLVDERADSGDIELGCARKMDDGHLAGGDVAKETCERLHWRQGRFEALLTEQGVMEAACAATPSCQSA